MFRENADMIRADHDRRGISHDSIDEIIRLDEEWRKAQYDTDQIRNKGTHMKGIAEAKKSGDVSMLKKFCLRLLISERGLLNWEPWLMSV